MKPNKEMLTEREKEIFASFEMFARGEAEAISEDPKEIASQTWYLQKVMFEGWKLAAKEWAHFGFIRIESLTKTTTP